MRTSMRRWLVTATLGLSLAIAGPGVARGEAPEVARLTIGAGIDQSVAAWAIIAKEKGYFERVGFSEIELKLFSSGSAMVEALAAGSLQVGCSGAPPVIIMRGQGLPVVILMPLGELGSYEFLFVAKDKNVQSPKDLEGLTLAFPKGSGATSAMLQFIGLYGLDATKIKIIDMTPADVVTAYKSGQVDGSFLWEPWPYLAEKARPTVRLHTLDTSFFPQNRGKKLKLGADRTMLSAREEFVRKNPRATEALVRAMVMAQEFAQKPENTKEYVRLVAAGLKQDPEMMAATFKFRPTSLVDSEFMNDMEIMTKFLFESKRLRQRPPTQDWLYTEPLAQAKPEWVKLRGAWKP